MATTFRTFLAALVVLLALPLSAQLDRVATTGGTSVERPRANTNQNTNRNTRTRATTTRTTNRQTDRTRTRTNDRQRDPNYCPPAGRSNNNRPATNPGRRTGQTRTTRPGNRWGNTSAGQRTGVRTRTTATRTTTDRSQSGVGTSILFGKKGQDVGRAKQENKVGTSYVPRQ